MGVRVGKNRKTGNSTKTGKSGKLDIQQNGKFRKTGYSAKWEFRISTKLETRQVAVSVKSRNQPEGILLILQIWKSRIVDKPYQKGACVYLKSHLWGLQFQISGIQQNTNGLVTVSC